MHYFVPFSLHFDRDKLLNYFKYYLDVTYQPILLQSSISIEMNVKNPILSGSAGIISPQHTCHVQPLHNG